MDRSPNKKDIFPYESKFVDIEGSKIHYIEEGTQEPTVLLLHGIPANAFMWRNVIPYIAPYARVIALDFIGFGKSDKPENIQYDLQTYTAYLQKFIEVLHLKNVLIVGMDLGLIIGLNYAMHDESNVSGIVMFEGFFVPVDIALKNQPFINRFFMGLMRKRKIAENAFIKNGENTLETMISKMVVRKLSKEEMEEYKRPFKEEKVRQKVWLEGIGPHTLVPKSEKPGDVTDLINQYLERLYKSSLPKKILYASPGSAITEKSIDYVKKYISNTEYKYVGKGTHFLPEDQPEAIGKAIVEFHNNFTKSKEYIAK